MATHSSILAWRSPWTEEPGGLQPVGPQRVGHDWATDTFPFREPRSHSDTRRSKLKKTHPELNQLFLALH